MNRMTGKRKGKADQQTSKVPDHASETESDNSDEEAGETGHKWTPAKTRGKKILCQGGEKACGLEVTKDTENVMCEGCGNFYHIECQEISMGAYRAWSRYRDVMTWLCLKCKPKLEWLMTSKRLEERIEVAEKKILEVMEKMEKSTDEKRRDMERTMAKKMMEQKEAISENSEVLQKVAKEQKGMEQDFTKVAKSIDEQQQVIKENTSEMKKATQNKDMEARAMNIIVHNIEESNEETAEKRKEHDYKKFTKIAAALGAEELQVENIIRLNRKQDSGSKKTRLMLVKMKKADDADLLFRRRFNLKASFENIYITKDMPPEERLRQRKLREELKEKGKDTHTIFRGKVVPRRT